VVGAVLCDLDGVLRLWDQEWMGGLDAAYGLPASTLAGAAFRAERLDPAITGGVTDEEWRAAVAGDLAERCGSADRARELVAAWSAQPARVDREVLELLTAVRRRVPVVLVSNATTRLEADLAALGLDGALDAVVNTARIGVAKPDERVYRIAAELAGTAPEGCLFVDDTAGHVAAARAVGMTGVHYRGISDLREALGAWS